MPLCILGGTPDMPVGQIEKMMAEHRPLSRCALSEDVVRVVAFLCSEDGGWVNGQVITISGGSNQQLAIRDPFDQTTLTSGGNSSAVAMPHGVHSTNFCVCRLLHSTLLEGGEDALIFC